MRHVLVRYGELGKKSEPVKSQMQKVLRQRVADKLRYENIEQKASTRPGRIIVETSEPEKAAEKLKLVPGVASASPAEKAPAEMEEIKEAARGREVGDTFGVRANTAFTELSSQEIEKELGAYTEEEKDASVDLDSPETWLGVEIREEDAYVFTEKVQGVNGLPVGTQGKYAALISGGIDSPVAAFEMMKRGADIVPVYFFNKPIAAGDHLLRFEKAIEKLRDYHPGKKWSYYLVDMEKVNQELLEVGKGRMILHRKIMFAVAEEIAQRENLKGIATGESLGQKSSQTAQNLEMTTQGLEKPLMRPLLTWNKEQAVEKAREIGTYGLAEVNSACRTLAPENPATELKQEELKEIKEEAGFKELVETALESLEKKEL